MACGCILKVDFSKATKVACYLEDQIFKMNFLKATKVASYDMY
jgi:hypothetical protein